ncbi:transmembrane and coiled-coil domains protein 1-like isoform X2 [Narcine bancroftii]|uniref:transmembrane and coiled-coil domains protein 1-like isoform X2 n=1 Tax=Narcine bancroftii TaxID=1343680 RepID=UPI00383138D7
MDQINNDPSLNDLDSRATDIEGRKPSELEHTLSKIKHHTLDNFGQGLKQLFHHQRRRSSVSPQDGLRVQADQEPQGPDVQTTALNRVLQQFRVAPAMKRGASLHKRTKLDLPRGSPQVARKLAPDGMGGRPRSSSTTEAPSSSFFVESLAFAPHSGDEFDQVERLQADGGLDPQRKKAAIAHLRQKVLKLTEELKVEQAARDGNVAEYLELAASADRHQGARVKQAFEKKNQRSAQAIQKLQRRLEQCRRKLRDTEWSGGLAKPRDVDSVPHRRSGSVDSIPALRDSLDEEEEDEEALRAPCHHGKPQPGPGDGSEEECSSATSGSAANSVCGEPLEPAQSRHSSLSCSGLWQQLQQVKDTQVQLEETFDALKSHHQRRCTLLLRSLQEERYRCERLEDQLNDLTELHQHEILNLKQELVSMEEKIAYQSCERAQDIQECLESCQTRISKMELQQQQQQAAQLEGLEQGTARTLLGKLITVLLALIAVLLVFLSTLTSCLVPLMRTGSRTVCTLLLLALLGAVWRNWAAISWHMGLHVWSPT